MDTNHENEQIDSDLLLVSPNLIKRFLEKIKKQPGTGCWVWQGFLNEAGYGMLRSVELGTSAVRAHRFSYELFVGPLEEGKHIHHVCENTRCVNPDHLEQLTPKEHTHKTPNSVGYIAAHVTECPQGHPYDDKNTGYRSNGKRYCKACSIEACNLRRMRLKIESGGQLGLKEDCIQGHPLSGENLYFYKTATGVGRGCRICRAAAVTTYHEKNRDAINARKRELRLARKTPEQLEREAWLLTHCVNGHEWNEDNTGQRTKGTRAGERYCKACDKAQWAARSPEQLEARNRRRRELRLNRA